MESPKLFMMVIFDFVDLIGKANFQISIKSIHFPYFSCGDIIFWRLSICFEIEMKTAIFKLILPNFIEEKYHSKGYFYINNHLTSTLSIAQTNYISVFWNVKMTQKCHLFWSYRTYILVQRSQNTPTRPKIQQKLLVNRALMVSIPNILMRTHTPIFVSFL